MDIWGFLGALHPAAVHLPIAFVLLLVLVEWRHWQGPWRRPLIMITAISGMIAASFGWLSAGGDLAADNPDLAWHRWSGTALGLGLIALLALEKRMALYRFALASTVLMTLIVGFFGGNLVHGRGHLWQALFPLAELPPEEEAYNERVDAVFFSQRVEPILEEYCIDCHGSRRSKGGLRLDQPVAAFGFSGVDGPALIPYHPRPQRSDQTGGVA